MTLALWLIWIVSHSLSSLSITWRQRRERCKVLQAYTVDKNFSKSITTVVIEATEANLDYSVL